MTSSLITFLFVLGACLGSFLNVVVYRMPLNLSVVTPRSSCPKCKHKIRWYENIPILSWLFLRGKCSNCSAKISARYVLVEFLMGIIAMLLSYKLFSATGIVDYIFFLSVAFIFVAQFLIDIDHHLLPDKLNIYLLLLFLTYAFTRLDIYQSLIGGAIGFGGPFLITWIFYKLKNQVGLGGGDIKLYGVLGLYLGPVGIITNIFYSAFLGSIFGIALIGLKKMKRTDHFAFGPYILIVAAFQIFAPILFKKINMFNL